MTLENQANLEVMRLWADKLESGQYKQGHRSLRHADEYCCLGVLCEVAVEQGVIDPPKRDNDPSDPDSWHYMYDGFGGFPSVRVTEWAFGPGADSNPMLKRENGLWREATMMNDTDGASFAEIAAAVRRTFGV